MKDNGSLRVIQAPETLRTQVVDRLRRAIADQTLPQGSRLVERQLCELLGVSRTLVREALRQLEAEGFVIGNPRTGPTVARLDRETVREIYEVRAALEALGGRLFVERATPADRERLSEAFGVLEAAGRLKTAKPSIEATAEYYAAIFAGARNETIAATLRPLAGRITLLRERSMSVPGRRAVSRSEMQAIHQALLGNDPAKAWDACWKHVENALAYALQSLEA